MRASEKVHLFASSVKNRKSLVASKPLIGYRPYTSVWKRALKVLLCLVTVSLGTTYVFFEVK